VDQERLQYVYLYVHFLKRALTPFKAPGQGPQQLSTGQVLSELDFTLGHRQRSLQSNPFDPQLKRDIETLNQVSFASRRHFS
jgi:hypothetical protein